MQQEAKKEHHKPQGQALLMHPGDLQFLTNPFGLGAHQPVNHSRATELPPRNFHAAGFAISTHVCVRVLAQIIGALAWSSSTSLHSPHSTPHHPRLPFSGAYINTATPSSPLQEEQHSQIEAHRL
nr:unnamed protein product [Digitaria exilis]